MKKLTLALALAACLGGARTVSAAVENIVIHGSSCFIAGSGVPVYGPWGVSNSNANAGIRVNCPVQLPWQSYTTFILQATGWSRSNQISKLSCTITATGSDGNNSSANIAVLPYNDNSAVVGTTQINTQAVNPRVYVSCYIPKSLSPGTSYLSTLFLQAVY